MHEHRYNLNIVYQIQLCMRSSPNPLKNTALSSDGEAKIGSARIAFTGRGVLIPISALGHEVVSVGLGI